MFAKILVGTDGSDSASQAVAHAVGVAERTGAELIVVHAYPAPRPDPGPPFGGGVYAGPDIGRSILQDVERHHGSKVKMSTVLREGEAADVICDVAEEEKVDAIVVGNKGMAGAKRFVLGSVPNRVAHHAPCSVLIVHTT